MTLSQTTVFVWIFLRIGSDDEERMDDNFKPMMIIANLCYTVVQLSLNYDAWHPLNNRLWLYLNIKVFSRKYSYVPVVR